MVIVLPNKKWDMKDAIEDAIDTSNNATKAKGIQSESLLDVKLTTSWFSILFVTRSCLYAEEHLQIVGIKRKKEKIKLRNEQYRRIYCENNYFNLNIHIHNSE